MSKLQIKVGRTYLDGLGRPLTIHLEDKRSLNSFRFQDRIGRWFDDRGKSVFDELPQYNLVREVPFGADDAE